MKCSLKIPLFFVVLLIALNCAALTDEEAREKVKARVRSELSLPSSAFLNPHRLENLEESAFSFEPKVLGRSAKGLYFFEVSDVGIEVGRKQVLVHTSHHGATNRYVAVARESGELYLLYGFKSASENFNKLATDLRLHVRPESTERFALFYFECVFGPDVNTLVYSPLALRHSVESFYYSYSSAYSSPSKALRKAKKWWDDFERKHRSYTYGLRTNTTAEGINVTFSRIQQTPGKQPQLKEYTVKVTDFGQCTLVSVKDMYPI